jgi:uncharacterized RmlC-like cupin family protein
VDWRDNGVRVVHADELDPNTPQTPGMHRMAAIDAARAGAEKLWAGTVVIHPDAKTGPHHHGDLESVIYVVSGRARMRWGGVVVRSGQESVVVNLDMPAVEENPEEIHWVDDIHRPPGSAA